MSLILIVDDSTFARRATMKIVKVGGHEVMEAAEGTECLEMVGEHSPDCIILDLHMPEMSGLDVLKELGERTPGIPIIVQTADIQESVRKECLDLGAKEVVNKPPNMNNLLDAIANAVNAEGEV